MTTNILQPKMLTQISLFQAATNSACTLLILAFSEVVLI